jgi:hypothetical protein
MNAWDPLLRRGPDDEVTPVDVGWDVAPNGVEQ